MNYKVSEVHVHGCVTVERFDTLTQAIAAADRLQAASDTRPDDGWGSVWIVTRDGWYPTTQVSRLHETTPNRKGGAA